VARRKSLPTDAEDLPAIGTFGACLGVMMASWITDSSRRARRANSLRASYLRVVELLDRQPIPFRSVIGAKMLATFKNARATGVPQGFLAIDRKQGDRLAFFYGVEELGARTRTKNGVAIPETPRTPRAHLGMPVESIRDAVKEAAERLRHFLP
jgi:hypothetical protein